MIITENVLAQTFVFPVLQVVEAMKEERNTFWIALKNTGTTITMSYFTDRNKARKFDGDLANWPLQRKTPFIDVACPNETFIKAMDLYPKILDNHLFTIFFMSETKMGVIDDFMEESGSLFILQLGYYLT
jgi:hypothetical protein